jgi:hypothetical protein
MGNNPHLTSLLLSTKYYVCGSTGSKANVAALRLFGADPAAVDVLDAPAPSRAAASARAVLGWTPDFRLSA